MLTLIIVNPENYLDKIKDFIDKDTLIINFSHYFEDIRKINSKAQIIDALSYIYPVKEDGVIPISDPTNLTELSIYVSKIKPRKIIIDSLATMLIYNSSEEIIKLIDHLKSNSDLYLISINGHENIFEQIKALADNIVPLSSSG